MRHCLYSRKCWIYGNLVYRSLNVFSRSLRNELIGNIRTIKIPSVNLKRTSPPNSYFKPQPIKSFKLFVNAYFLNAKPM